MSHSVHASSVGQCDTDSDYTSKSWRMNMASDVIHY